MNINTNQLHQMILNEILHKNIAPQLKKLIEDEVIKELRKLGIAQRRFGRERGNQDISLVEGRDYRRRIGTLNTQRMQDGIVERVRVKLNGLQDRYGRTAIDSKQLRRIIQRVIERKLR